MVTVNYLAILLCGVASMGLGSLWFGPLFGKVWADSMGWTADQMEKMRNDPAGKSKMMRSYGIMCIGSLLMAYVLAHAIIFGDAYLNASGVSGGLQGAFWYWLGIVAPVTIGSVLWDGKPWKYWFITAGYYLVQMLMMGLILALWPLAA